VSIADTPEKPAETAHGIAVRIGWEWIEKWNGPDLGMSVRDLLFNALNDLSIRLEPDLRRLVEEAQAETKACKTTIETLGADLAASNAQLEACRDAARDSLDRLNGELKTMTCMWQGLVDNAPKLHGEIRRLKGELAEARRLLMTAPLNVHADSLLAWMKARTKHLATPPAEQAQGEGALTLEMLDEVLRDHINDEYDRSTELAKRVKALMEMVADQAEALRLHTHLTKDGSATYSPAPPPPEAAGPTCEKLIGSLNAPCTKRRNHGGDCEHDTREAAGPGHRFICSSGFDDNCGPSCVCKECDHRLGDHAVPPIPEGTR
jgi:hypothetical protein